jgi:hypothetical protein
MMTMLLIAGIAVLAAGLLAVALGIPVKEFSLGNTLILAGAVAACTGVIMLGLAVVVRELQNIARRLGPANPAEGARAKSEPQLPVAAPETLEGAESASKQPRSASSAAPWQEEVAARDRGRGDDAPEATPPEPAAATKPRRNLLFSSSSRRERERAAQTPDAAAADSIPPPMAPPVPPPAPKEPAPASFEDAWPQSDRTRSDALRRTRTPSTFAEPNPPAPKPERPAPAMPSEEPAPVTVLKSGVVDGMAYSLYSDGSIEAQMPEGMMRFASIDELRSHLDQRP